MKILGLSLFAFVLSMSLSLQVLAETESEPWYSVTLKSRGCGEIDTEIIGDACVYVATEKGSGRTLFIYDSLSSEDSDLSDWNQEPDLQAGHDCFNVQVYQTSELIGRYGANSYYASKIKRTQCQK